MDEQKEPLATFYAVRNDKGEYYKTYSTNSRRKWVKDLKDAKLWTREGQAKGKITAFTNEFPKAPVPELVEFIVREVNIVDQKERVAQTRQKKATKDAEREASHKQWLVKEAEYELKIAKANLEKLKTE